LKLNFSIIRHISILFGGLIAHRCLRLHLTFHHYLGDLSDFRWGKSEFSHIAFSTEIFRFQFSQQPRREKQIKKTRRILAGTKIIRLLSLLFFWFSASLIS
jgi:hypothetical protein